MAPLVILADYYLSMYSMLYEIFQYFYNPVDGALGLFTSELMFVVVAVVVVFAEWVTSSLSP